MNYVHVQSTVFCWWLDFYGAPLHLDALIYINKHVLIFPKGYSRSDYVKGHACFLYCKYMNVKCVYRSKAVTIIEAIASLKIPLLKKINKWIKNLLCWFCISSIPLFQSYNSIIVCLFRMLLYVREEEYVILMFSILTTLVIHCRTVHLYNNTGRITWEKWDPHLPKWSWCSAK